MGPRDLANTNGILNHLSPLGSDRQAQVFLQPTLILPWLSGPSSSLPSPFPVFLSAALITLSGAEGHRTERGALYPSAMGMDHFSVREQNFCLGSSVSVCQLGGKS